MINGKLAWIIQEAPSLIVPLWCFINGKKTVTDSVVNRILLAYFIGHYANRTIIFPLQIRGGKPTPFGVMLSALFFTAVNGTIQGRYLTQLHHYDDSHLTSPLFIIGTCLFLSGLLINLHSDSVLRNLRKPGETGYKIPYGGMFTYISGANFFGEILEWFGFAMATGFALPAVTFAFATTCNIAPRAVQHHQWYLTKFEDYEKLGRKAIIPFVY
jgi:3-oxo-5-alpha-steroid 4-dehydrogenase 1